MRQAEVLGIGAPISSIRSGAAGRPNSNRAWARSEGDACMDATPFALSIPRACAGRDGGLLLCDFTRAARGAGVKRHVASGAEAMRKTLEISRLQRHVQR